MFSSEHLAAILAALPDLVFVLTRSGRYAEVFGGADLRYYHDASGLAGHSVHDVFQQEKAAWFMGEIAQTLDGQGMRVVEYALATEDLRERGCLAEPIWFEGRIQRLDFPVLGEDAVLWVASNVTERHALEARLRAQSETDALTGLWNRRHFEKLASAEMHRAQRYAHPVSVLIFDIDHFKIVNDTCGHQVGDEVLVELAALVRASIRESDSLTRWGGEEFTVLMSDTGLDTAGQAAEKIRRSVAEHRFGHGLRVTISVGVAQWAGGHESLHTLISRADEALYTAKHGGRNRSALGVPDARPGVPALRRGLPLTLRWRPDYESGDAVIDAEHRALFEEAGELLQLLRLPDEGNVAALSGAIDNLLEHAAAHFRTEEGILAKKGWSGLAEHRSEHHQLLARARDLRKTLGTTEGLHEMVRFIAIEVVANHALRADREFFGLLAERG